MASNIHRLKNPTDTILYQWGSSICGQSKISVNKNRLRIIFLLVLILAPPASASSGASEKARLDSIRVNFEAQNLPLREALQNLVVQTNVQIVYHDALVKDIYVSCACGNASLRQALEILLTPTSLTFEVMSDGQIVIVARKVDLKGYVKAAQSGEALPYANVKIKGKPWTTISNVNGYFVLVNVPAGLCTLRVSYIEEAGTFQSNCHL